MPKNKSVETVDHPAVCTRRGRAADKDCVTWCGSTISLRGRCGSEFLMRIWIGSAVFAQLTHIPTYRRTDTHTCNATCDICSNRPHLCTVCRRCGLIIIIIIIIIIDLKSLKQQTTSSLTNRLYDGTEPTTVQ